MRASVLIVEDDPDMRMMLSLGLEEGGFRAVPAEDGQSGLDSFHSQEPDVVLIDVLLGHDSFDGFELCRRIRKSSHVPVVFLTVRGDEVDQILGIGLGADEYLVKPISPRLLCAKIDMILQRRTNGLLDAPPTIDIAYENGTLCIDNEARTVTVNGSQIDLTKIEFDLLTILAKSRDRVVTRDQITTAVWGDWYGSDAHVDVHMSRLRKKIIDAGGPRVGHSVRGIGFRLQ